MLGTFQLRNEEHVISRFRTRRVGLLLAYLAYYAGKSHDRAEVAEMLWPEGDPDKMSANLRQALASLRRQIEVPPVPSGGIIRSQNNTLTIDPAHVTTDVAEFEQSLSAAWKQTDPAQRRTDLEHAVALYRGALLPGFGEEWVMRERARLEDIYVHALRTLAESAQEEGHFARAIDALHRSLAIDPYNESMHAEVMRIHLEAGQPDLALEHYKDVEHRLADELGMAPDEALRVMARKAKRAISEHTKPLAPLASPAQAPVAAVRLPAQLTRLFGHQSTQAELVEDFSRHDAGFVTLLGPAGAGKTTLAIAVARQLAEKEGWNAGFVPMADFAEPSMVLEGVADALRAGREHASDVYARIRSGLGPGENLVVLDNAEHIANGLAPLIAHLRQEIPQLRLLVTSRQSLKVADERAFILDLLEVPAGEQDKADQLAHFPSVALFVDRARAVQPDFALTPRNAGVVAEICARLDGLPLAIELAAGLSGAFTPTQMLGHLERRLAMLKTRRRDAPLRHRSLAAALDYSYDILSDSLKSFFRRLSVFSGGFTLDAAAQVGLDEPDENVALQMLLDLQERSLVFAERSEEEDAVPRFRLLESFREYGRDRLSEEERRENALTHADFFFATIPPSVEGLKAAERRRFRMDVLQDHANYWIATNTLIANGRLDDAVAMLAATTQTGPLGKPRLAEFEALRRLDFKRLTWYSQALAYCMMGVYQRAINGVEAAAVYGEAVACARQVGDLGLLVRCLAGLAACVSGVEGPEAGLAIYQEVLEYESIPGVGEMTWNMYNGIGTTLWMLNRLDEADAAFREGLRLSREEPGEETNWLARYNLGRVSLDRERYDVAIPIIGDALRIARRVRDTFGISMAMGLMARYRWKTGDLEGAFAANQEAMSLRRNLGLVFWFANAIRFQALLLADRGDASTAVILFAATERHTTDRLGEVFETGEALQKIRSQLSSVQFQRAWERGSTLDLNEAYEIVG